MATWRSGDAADCKSAHPGSIPGVASNLSKTLAVRAIGAAVARHGQTGSLDFGKPFALSLCCVALASG